MATVRTLGRALLISCFIIAALAPAASAQTAGREHPVEIGRASTIPDRATAGEPFTLDLSGMMSTTDTFKEVRLRRLDLVTLPPLQVVEVDAYAVDAGGFGIEKPWASKKELTLPAGEWTLRFNKAFGNSAVFEKKVVVTGDAPAPEELAFADIDRGAYGGIGEARSVVITDQASWERLWREHKSTVLPAPPVPAVDFAEEVVIARFMGTRNTGGYATRIESIRGEGAGWVVNVVESSPAPGQIVTQALTQPYHIVRAKKPADPTFRFEVRAAGDQPLPGPVAVTSLAKGERSRITTERNAVVRDADAWKALWAEHMGPLPGAPAGVRDVPGLPPVDFDREMVIARFMGSRSSNRHETTINSVVRDARDAYRVNVTDRLPGPNEAVGRVITSPFHIVKTPKNGAGVTFDVAEQRGPGVGDYVPVQILPTSRIPAEVVAGNPIELDLQVRLAGDEIFYRFEVEKLDRIRHRDDGALVSETVFAVRALGQKVATFRAGLPRTVTESVIVASSTTPEGTYVLAFNGARAADEQFERTLTVRADATEVRFETVEAGERSRIEDERNVVVRDGQTWERLWKEHKGAPQGSLIPIPAVDFDREIVVARFMGLGGPGKTGIRDVVRNSRDDYTVNVDEVLFPIPPNVRLAPTAAFHIMRGPKNGGEVSFNVQLDDRRDQRAVEITRNTEVPDRITADEQLTLKLRGIFRIGDEIADIRIEQAADAITVNAYARSTRPGVIGVETGWEQERKVGPLAPGDYTVRFNTDFLGGGAQFERKVTVEPGAGGTEVTFRSIELLGESAIKDERNVVIRDAQTFEKLWKEHKGAPENSRIAIPFVDFRREMVIARFMGTTAPAKMEIRSIVKDADDDDYTVNVSEVFREIPPNVRLAPTSAVHIVAATRTDGEVRFDIQQTRPGDRGQPVEITQNTEVPDRVANGEDVILKIRGIMRIGQEISEIRVEQRQLEIFPPINVIAVDAFARNVPRALLGVERPFEQEKNLGPLPEGEYTVRFNGEFGNDAQFERQVIVGRGGERIITGTVDVEGRTVTITPARTPATGGLLARPLTVTNAPAEVFRYLRLLDGKQVTVLARSGAGGEQIEVERLMEPSLTAVSGTAAVQGGVDRLVGGDGTLYDVGGNLRGAVRQFDGQRITVTGFVFEEQGSTKQLIGVQMDATPSRRNVNVRPFPLPFLRADRLGGDDLVSVEGSFSRWPFGRFFFVRYKKDGEERTGWLAARDVEPRNAIGFRRVLEGAAEGDGD